MYSLLVMPRAILLTYFVSVCMSLVGASRRVCRGRMDHEKSMGIIGEKNEDVNRSKQIDKAA